MTLRKPVLKVLSIGLIAGGSVLEVASFYQPILRDGNEPIAGMLALVGILTIVGGWVVNGRIAEPATRNQLVRTRLLLEHICYASIGGALWLVFERERFFIDTTFAENILPIFRFLMAIFTITLILSFALRISLPVPGTKHKRALFPISALTWQTSSVAVVLMAVLNVVQGQEIIRSDNGWRITVLSRGFPLPAVQTIPITAIGKSIQGAKSLTLPDGTTVDFSEDPVTVTRFPHHTKYMEKGVREVMLSDRTRIQFGKETIHVNLRGGTPITLSSSGQATFPNGLTRRVNAGWVVVDAIVLLLLTIHCATSFERLATAKNSQALCDT